jgi:hypothetical protein
MPQGPEFRVNTYTSYAQQRPSAAVDATGSFVVVWMSYRQDGSGDGVFGQRYSSSGSVLGPEFRVNTYTTSSQIFPSVASDASGSFVVVWMSQDGWADGVFGQRYAASGAPLGPEFRVNTYTTDQQQRPLVAVGPSGGFVVVWNSAGQDGSGFGLFGQRYDGTGTPVGGEFRVNTYTTYAQTYPSVAFDPSGTFVVVWTSGQDGSQGGIVGQRFSASGAPLGGEFRVNSYTTGNQFEPSVSASAGLFVVVWTGASPDGSSDILGQRYAISGAPLGGEFRVNSYTTGGQGFASTTVDAAGSFVVVWASPQDGSGFGIFGQRYDSSGTPLGPEFRANTYTTGQQFFSDVGSDSTGRFVIAWGSSAQDGSGYGVFGQRFSAISPVELMRFGVE